MKIAGIDRCINCMQPLNKSEVCLRCGYNEKDHKTLTRALAPGTCLADRYYVGRVLGHGGFGITYVAWDNLLQIRVAIKEYYPENNIIDDKEKVLREARILSKFVALPGVVVARDFFEYNDKAYLIMEYINGMRISSYIKKNGPMGINDVLEKMEPVIRSLATIHESGYLHKDISANNIMITEEGELVLIDFGAARTIEHSDATITVAVKIGYSPEEQYRTTGKLGPWSDIYSLCATIYYMLTGTVPAESVERVITDRVIKLETNDNIKADKTLKHAIDKGMAVMASDRYQSVSELFCELYPGKELSEIKSVEINDDRNVTEETTYITETGTISETSLKRAIQRLVQKEEDTINYKKIISIALVAILVLFSIVYALVIKKWPEAQQTTTTSTDTTRTTPETVIPETISTALPTATSIADVPLDNTTFIIVPYLEKKTYRTAKKQLEKAGFTVKKKNVYSSKKKNTIINQSIAPSTKVAYGTIIELTVSKGTKKIQHEATSKPVNTSTQRPVAKPVARPTKKPEKIDDSAGALD